jgi:NADPH:quinone reductase
MPGNGSASGCKPPIARRKENAMQAAVVTAAGVKVQDVPEPKPGPTEVLIRVRAAALNRADLAVAAGHAHGRIGGAGTIVGMEFAGEVVAVGAEVPASIAPGMRVMASGAGGYAEYALADWGRVAPVPDRNMGWAQAATLPIALQTMHNALVTAGGLRAGEAVLIQGASSGVGLMAMQIAKAMGARLVIGTSTNAERRAKLKDYGCDVAIDTGDPAWPDQVLDATGGKGVELIIDQVSASVANGNLKCCAILGRIVNVGRLGGFKGEFDFDLHALRRIAYIGVTFRTRSVAEVREIVRLMKADLWGKIEDGTLRLPIDRSFPLAEAAAALEHMKANRHFGKIVLEC